MPAKDDEQDATCADMDAQAGTPTHSYGRPTGRNSPLRTRDLALLDYASTSIHATSPVSKAELIKFLRDISTLGFLGWTAAGKSSINDVIAHLEPDSEGSEDQVNALEKASPVGLTETFRSVFEELTKYSPGGDFSPEVIRDQTWTDSEEEPIRIKRHMFKHHQELVARCTQSVPQLESILTDLEDFRVAISSSANGHKTVEHWRATLDKLHGYIYTGSYSNRLIDKIVFAVMRGEVVDGENDDANLKWLADLLSGCIENLQLERDAASGADFRRSEDEAIGNWLSLIIMFGEEMAFISEQYRSGEKDGLSGRLLCDLVEKLMKLRTAYQGTLPSEVERKMVKLLAGVSLSGALGDVIRSDVRCYVPVSRMFMDAFRSDRKSWCSLYEAFICAHRGRGEGMDELSVAKVEREMLEAADGMQVAAAGINEMEGTSPHLCLSSRPGSFPKRLARFFSRTCLRSNRRRDLCEIVEGMIMRVRECGDTPLLEGVRSKMTEQVDKALENLITLGFDSFTGISQVTGIFEAGNRNRDVLARSTLKKIDKLKGQCEEKKMKEYQSRYRVS